MAALVEDVSLRIVVRDLLCR